MNRRALRLRRLGPTQPVRVPLEPEAHKWEPGPGTEDIQLSVPRAEAAGLPVRPGKGGSGYAPRGAGVPGGRGPAASADSAP